MPHAVRRPICAAVVALCAFAPAASARTSRLSKTDRTQNAAIRKAARSATAAGRSAAAASRTARSAASSAAAGLAAASTAGRQAGAAQSGVDALLGDLPQITDRLGQLLTGLTTIDHALAAREYGTVELEVGTGVVPTSALSSGAIPDDMDGATLTATEVAVVPAGAQSVPIRLLAGVRSDGGPGAGTTSAGLVSMTVGDPTGAVTIRGGNLGVPAATPLSSAPNAAHGGGPVYDIPQKAPRPGTPADAFSFPAADAIDLTDPATLHDVTGAGAGPFTATNPGADPEPITVTFTVRFADLAPSAAGATAG